MKLWQRSGKSDAVVDRFTAGKDPELDRRLVQDDCRASAAHAAMLHRIGVLTEDELTALEHGLARIAELDRRGEFVIRPEEEDVHTAIENFLTEACGEVGKKIHTGRSRNDQVLAAMRLYEKRALGEIEMWIEAYRGALGGLIERCGSIPLPGYTHQQRAMPTTVALWAGSFDAAAADDLLLLRPVMTLVDRSPLGSAAGFGVPGLPVDRAFTAERLGFAEVLENPLYAQLGRGKIESAVLAWCTQILLGLNRLATDLALFATVEFGFVRLPSALTTGSSIMPQKRNPDVLELVRARYHAAVGDEMKIKGIAANLMSGYNRDLQLTKQPLFDGLDSALDCLEVMTIVLEGVEFDEARCRAAITDEMFATERVYELVRQGVPFRDAYRTVASRYAREDGD